MMKSLWGWGMPLLLAPLCLSQCNPSKCSWKLLLFEGHLTEGEKTHLLFQGLCIFLGEACLWNLSFYPWIAIWELSFDSAVSWVVSASPDHSSDSQTYSISPPPPSRLLFKDGKTVSCCCAENILLWRVRKKICIFQQKYWAIFTIDV